MPQAMIYATGGAALAKTDYTGLDGNTTACPIGCGVVSFSNTKFGWVVGGGAEYMLTLTGWCALSISIISSAGLVR
jgi:opacity protein-like surface antigen